MSEEKLSKIRDQIDAIDRQLVELINKRAQCAIEVAHVKQASSSDDDTINFFRPEREAQVMRKVKAINKGPLADEQAARLIREVMSTCLSLEQPLTIAYLGPEGTYTQNAAYKQFGHAVTTVPMATIQEVFKKVESGSAHYGLVPVENSTEGVVTHTLDTFMTTSLSICGEVELAIHHNLANLSGDISQIKQIYSHQQSFAQCQKWLTNNMPNIDCIPVSSNAEAARLASENKDAAAICGLSAVEVFNLSACEANIEDMSNNTTRFLVIGKEAIAPSGDDKTSLLIATQNKPGALLNLLKPFTENNISMSKIESRPAPSGLWEYVFYIDIEGHQQDETVADALGKLKQHSSLLKVLGSYPKAVI
ncbi:MAG: prephenate dehydratase [Gammaproteobacteria bacterium]|nr:prephenate dehydratase [Gammaproteobacteria bacterium]